MFVFDKVPVFNILQQSALLFGSTWDKNGPGTKSLCLFFFLLDFLPAEKSLVCFLSWSDLSFSFVQTSENVSSALCQVTEIQKQRCEKPNPCLLQSDRMTVSHCLGCFHPEAKISLAQQSYDQIV